jgi:MoxR-like ATPase
MAGDNSSLTRLVENVERVIHGKREQVRLAVIGFLAGGHVLLEDVPGTGKTTLAQALARSLDLTFRRVQFTSDLLPSDVLGVSVFDAATSTFRFREGPIFGNVILADELNRTTPRTQSALLECMNTASISLDGETRRLPSPFMVVATQNPLEFEGTYPLPESQLDRFLMRVRMGHPDRAAERRILSEQTGRRPLDDLRPVMTRDEAIAAISRVGDVRVETSLVDYVLDLVEATRDRRRFLLGLSTRAAQAMYRAAQARALLDGRSYCVPDDVKELAVPVFAHRVVVAAMGALPAEPEAAVREVLEAVPVPA